MAYPALSPPLVPTLHPASTEVAAGATRTRRRALPLDLLREARPTVQAVFALRLVVGSALVHGLHSAAAGVLLPSWFALTAAVYIYNGMTDLEGDRVNGSRRPLAQGRISLTTARRAVLLLATLGLTGCALADPMALVPAVALLVLGWAYSSGPALKSSPVGSAVVIGLGAALTYAAGWTLRPDRPFELVVGGAVAVWVGTTCAAKDFSDVHGDRIAGRRSWPVALGAVRAGRLLAGLTVLTAALVAATSVTVPDLRPAAVVIGIGSLALVAQLLLPARRSAGPGGPRRPYRVFMDTQFAANLAILLALVVS